MASANFPGLIEVRVERSGMGEKPVITERSDGPINAGKSPDGVLANLTADKQMFIPFVGPVLRAGDIIRLYFKPDSADGSDVSDCVFQIPYWEDGIKKTLNASKLGITTDIPAGTLADRWVEYGTGYTIPSNVKSARLGNGRIVISIENDT